MTESIFEGSIFVEVKVASLFLKGDFYEFIYFGYQM